MTRTLVPVVLSALVSATVTAAILLPTADAAGTKVVCSQIPQGLPPRPSQVDDQFVANFMSEQIAAGRERFQTVQGMSTVLCAW